MSCNKDSDCTVTLKVKVKNNACVNFEIKKGKVEKAKVKQNKISK